MDVLKGMTIITVVFFHVVAHFYLSSRYPEIAYIFERMSGVISPARMSLFIMLSGIVFALVFCSQALELDKGRYRRQLANILGPYIVFSLLWGFLKLNVPGYLMPYDVVTAASMYLLLLVPLPLCHLWFLHTMLLLYLTAGVGAIRRWAGKYGYLLLVLMPVLVPLLNEQLPGEELLAARNFIQFVGFFLFGIYYCQHQGSRLFSAWAAVLWLLLGSLLYAHGNYAYGINIIIMESWILGAVSLAARFGISCPPLEYIGRKSMDVYIWHFFLVAITCNWLYGLVGSALVTVLLATALCTGMSIFLSLGLERLGIYTWLFRPGKAYGSLKH